jgi:hypothetical protein
MGLWAGAGGQISETVRQPRDRLTEQPPERSLIAAAKSTPLSMYC